MGPTESMLISTSVIWFFWRRQKPCCCALHFINHVFMWTRSGHLTAQTWAFAVARRAPACLFSRTDLRGAVQHASNYFWLFSFARVRLALPALLEGGFPLSLPPPPGPAVGRGGDQRSASPSTPFPRVAGGSGDPPGLTPPVQGVGPLSAAAGSEAQNLQLRWGHPAGLSPPPHSQAARGIYRSEMRSVQKRHPPPPTENTDCLRGKKNKRPHILTKKTRAVHVQAIKKLKDLCDSCARGTAKHTQPPAVHRGSACLGPFSSSCCCVTPRPGPALYCWPN